MTELQKLLIDTSTDRYLSVLCPYHQDTNPSAGYNPAKGFFNCFTCGKRATKKELEVFFGKEKEEEFDGFQEQQLDESLFDSKSNNLLLQTITANNPDNPQHPLYIWLSERKISWTTFQHWNGRYISEPGRVVFQEHDLFGHIIIPFPSGNAFIARNMTDVGNRYFEYGKKALFNQECLGDYKDVFLVEGISDFLAMWEMGFKNTVCCFGCEPSEKLLYPLRGKTIYILFDLDYAGYKGSKETLGRLKGLGANPIILEIPKHFSSGTTKVDVGSAWAEYENSFRDWLDKHIAEFSSYDAEPMRNFLANTLPKTIYASTGLKEFDEVLNGGFATGLHVIGGEPESGKSTLVTHLVDTFCGRGKRILFCTYELPRQQVYARIASRYSKHSWQEIERNPSVLSTEPHTVTMMNVISNKLKVVVDWNINHITAAIDAFDIVVLDYIQRMPIMGKDVSLRDGIIFNLNKLSDFCRNLNKIVVLVSSIPRASYGDVAIGSRTMFKWAGEIEYVAQSASVLKRVGLGFASLNTEKNTRGRTQTTIYLKVDGEHQLLSEANLDDIIQ
jgi:archaellum biogenesis ATPase FlaH/5S rRNA maturation endonuclease (ribonuclease M5)